MRFVPTAVDGAWVLEPERVEDERGFFARSFCRKELEERGLDSRVAQCNISYNPRRGTLRGMHYQAAPHAEVKIVRCTAGSIWDVVLDIRPDSPTFMKHHGVTLTAENRTMLYLPAGCAHGFQTLEDRTEVFYQMSVSYEAAAGRGVRWDDPAFGIPWPHADARIINDRDRTYPDFKGTR